jgi:hypothetical protein
VRVVEHSVTGKHVEEIRCEDRVFIGDGLVAVIDGATDKTGWQVQTANGLVKSGRFAADVVAAALVGIEAGTEPVQAVALLTAALDDAIRQSLGVVAPHERPAASIVVYDAVLRAVWRVGDCPFRVGGVLHNQQKRIDEVTANFRAAVLAAVGSYSFDRDPGRDAIEPLLRRQGSFANKLGEFGYGVIDGQRVPEEFIEVAVVPGGVEEVVLASDGYPTLPSTLAEAEAELTELLAADPHCVGALRGTKGLTAGLCSFDDRAWVRVLL